MCACLSLIYNRYPAEYILVMQFKIKYIMLELKLVLHCIIEILVLISQDVSLAALHQLLTFMMKRKIRSLSSITSKRPSEPHLPSFEYPIYKQW
jgi:hypothetical protein